MSDEDRDVDIESDDDGDESGGSGGRQPTQEEKRAHHNALERKRRDHIKDSFSSLRDSVPDLQGEKVSRAQILKRAAEYITSMKEKNTTNVKDIESMKRANKQLEQEIAFLENYPESGDQVPGFNEENVRSDLSDEEDQNRSRRKRQKVATANS